MMGNVVGQGRIPSIAALALGLAGHAALGAGAGQAQPAVRAAAPALDEARLLKQRRLVEASERSNRSRPPPPRRPLSANKSLIQIPVDLRRRVRPAKLDRVRLAAPMRPSAGAAAAVRSRGVQSNPPDLPILAPNPPVCPNLLPYPDPLGEMPPMRTASIVKAFPELIWHICVTDMGRKGLWIGPVELRLGAKGPWMPVIRQAGLAEIFVPYHLNLNIQDVPDRVYDLHHVSALAPLEQHDFGLDSEPVWLTTEDFATVALEIRGRGPGWVCKGEYYKSARQGRDLVISAISDAGNYDNIIEYGFRDDGGITFRMGNTGFNSQYRPNQPHTHNALWYVDMDLNGSGGDSAFMLTHDEAAPSTGAASATDSRTPIAVEGSRQWDPQHLGTLLIEDSAVNVFGHHPGYEFSAGENAMTRHFGSKEEWTENDIHVTRWSDADALWASPIANYLLPDDYVLAAMNDNQSTVQQDLVVWIKTAAHHTPTDEDKGFLDSWIPGTTGVTLTHWSGFKIEPHNLFAVNQLGAPMRCDPFNP